MSMQNFPLRIAAVKKMDGFNPQHRIASEYECMLRSSLKLCYVFRELIYDGVLNVKNKITGWQRAVKFWQVG